MSDPLYVYGNSMAQYVVEAQRDVVSALDLLIEEMCAYMRDKEEMSADFETDEHQAWSQHFMGEIAAIADKAFPGTSEPENKSYDHEAEKQSIRDKNIAMLGRQEKRLSELSQLRQLFATTEPASVPRAEVDKVHGIFKEQIMRCAMSIGGKYNADVANTTDKLIKYCRATDACGSLSETWDLEDIYPFCDDES